MKIHEYQGKEILRKFGVTVPRGIPCMSLKKPLKRLKLWAGQSG
jgi:succinyl-CoA synthetase beta subunit